MYPSLFVLLRGEIITLPRAHGSCKEGARAQLSEYLYIKVRFLLSIRLFSRYRKTGGIAYGNL